MSTTDTRAAFKAEHLRRFGWFNDALYGTTDCFADGKLQDRWEGWQAATEAAKATGTAAQESAPAELPIKTWQERLHEKFPETADRNLFAVGHLEHAMEAEIADLRAALSRPVVAIPVNWKEQALRQYRHNDGSEGLVFAYDFEVINRLLAAAPASPHLTMPDTDIPEALELLSYVFDAWENGVECYEDPHEYAGYIGTAFKLDDEVFNRCCDLLNRRNPPRNSAPQPVAKVLTDARIEEIAIDTGGSGWVIVFARAIEAEILAASTPTTLTEPGNGSQS